MNDDIVGLFIMYNDIIDQLVFVHFFPIPGQLSFAHIVPSDERPGFQYKCALFLTQCLCTLVKVVLPQFILRVSPSNPLILNEIMFEISYLHLNSQPLFCAFCFLCIFWCSSKDYFFLSSTRLFCFYLFICMFH